MLQIEKNYRDKNDCQQDRNSQQEFGGSPNRQQDSKIRLVRRPIDIAILIGGADLEAVVSRIEAGGKDYRVPCKS